tara:strand:+ start:107 stop:469 length:363 start_codon:yes stop_codon:yes gene_type:complete
MTKPFSIHDWQAKQAKQRLTENDRFPGEDEAGMAPRTNDLETEISSYIGQTFASWMSPENPPFHQAYAKPPYMDKLVGGIMDIVNGGGLSEMSSTGTGASFNAGSGEGYMTPNAFKKKKK